MLPMLFFVILAFVCLGALLSGYVMTLFFYYLLTPLFGAPEITYWQGFWLVVFISFVGSLLNSSVRVGNK